MLGLPDTITACLFDLDGVLTQTAKVHNAAWTQVFDEVLAERAKREGTPFTPFDSAADYNTYVDGKPRADGVRDFLASRGITLPDGSPDDPPDQPYAELTVNGVGNRKNVVLLQRIHDDGVQPYDGSVRYLKAARDAGLRRVVVSASANCRDVLAAAGLTDLLEERVDGVTLAEKHLRGKPAPDGFLEGARTVDTDPAHCAVFEDALSGVAAGRAGNFGFVVGVNRVNQKQGLLDHGATIVVDDLADLLASPNGDAQ